MDFGEKHNWVDKMIEADKTSKLSKTTKKIEQKMQDTRNTTIYKR